MSKACKTRVHAFEASRLEHWRRFPISSSMYADGMSAQNTRHVNIEVAEEYPKLSIKTPHGTAPSVLIAANHLTRSLRSESQTLNVDSITQ